MATSDTTAGPRIVYRVLNERPDDPPRTVDVHATPAELEHLRREGYVVRERVVPPELLARLRAAADEVEAIERPRAATVSSRNFGGLFVRNLIDRHATFHELLRFAPTLSVARAVLGPMVQVHATVLRVSYPHEEHQGVEWHFHQRVIPDPMPAWFYRPAVVDNLIYLDDLTQDAGPLVVLPRTHLVDRGLPAGDFSDKPGQVVVTCPAGSVVTSHAGLWHRAMAPRPGAPKRRLLILGYSPTWMKQIDKPSAGAGRGLTDALAKDADAEMRELLGIGGFF
jgi:ectoine hydroxylase-related dioxygenase (phytanoyl-CoA dioxygenase family)